MHYHKPEVVSEGVGNEKPGAREILKPDLWLISITSIHQGQPSIFNLTINIKSSDFLSSNLNFKFYCSSFLGEA